MLKLLRKNRLTHCLFRSSSKSVQCNSEDVNDATIWDEKSKALSPNNLKTCENTNRHGRLQPRWFWKSSSISDNNHWETFSDIDNDIIEEAFIRQQDDTEIDEYSINLKDYVGSRKNDERNLDIRIKRSLTQNSIRPNRYTLPAPTLSDPFGTCDPSDEFHRDYYEIFPYKDDDELLELAAQGILIEGERLNKTIEAKWIAEKLRSLVEYMKNHSSSRGREMEPKKTVELLLYLYTRDSFLYRTVNEALRQNDRSKFDTFGPFCYLMFYFCNPYGVKCGETFLQPFYDDVILYRGCNLTFEQIRQYRSALHTTKVWQSFTSTTKNRQLAEIFGNTLFILHVKQCSRVADISHFSNFPEEEEVLLPSGTCFKIEKVKREKDGKYNIYLDISSS